jgi:hypothetical protein
MFSAGSGSMLYTQNRPKRTKQPFDARPWHAPGGHHRKKKRAAVLHRGSTAVRSRMVEGGINEYSNCMSLVSLDTGNNWSAIPHDPMTAEAIALDDREADADGDANHRVARAFRSSLSKRIIPF